MQITPRVHALRIPFRVPTGPNTGVDRFVYAFAVLGERTWLIDTGVAGSAPALLEFVRQAGRSPESIGHIVLTHGHADHLGSAHALRERTGARVHAHPAERRWIEDIDAQARERPIPGFAALAGSSVAIDDELEDDQRLELDANLHVRVLHTPGHSPGSTSLLIEEEGVLVTGDATPVPGDMPVYDDPVASMRSLARLRQLANVRVVVSSWDEPRRDGDGQDALRRGAELVERVHRAVHDVMPSLTRDATTPWGVDPIQLCRGVLAALDLPLAMANPLVARTLLGHLTVGTDALR